MQGGVNHLTGNGTFPDQVIEFLLVFGQELIDFNRFTNNRTGADGLMSFLSIFSFGFECTGRIRQVVFAIFFANKFPNAKIIALEPEPKNIEQFKLNTQNYPNIKLVEAALWKNSGWIEIVDKGLGEAGFMVKEVPEKSSKSIKSISLDKLIQEFDIQVIDYLKIDIEGSEKEVFQNADKWLNHLKSFSIELHDHMKQGCSKSVFKAVTQHNFQFDQKGENLLFFNLAYA